MQENQRTEISTIGEFGLIKRLTEHIQIHNPETKYGVGDDAAVLDFSNQQTLVTTDLLMEGVHFDLVYTPLKHLGYKCVTAVTGELYAEFSHPRTMEVRLGISSKLDFEHIKDVWNGIVTAAKEHGYKAVDLDLIPSHNGLAISVSTCGETSLLMAKRRPAAKSMDLICVSDNLGAAYMGFQVLEREKRKFEKSGDAKAQPELEEYKHLVGAYLKRRFEIVEKNQQRDRSLDRNCRRY